MSSERYDTRIRPVLNHSVVTRVTLSMSLYQILDINEKQQSCDLNVWRVGERRFGRAATILLVLGLYKNGQTNFWVRRLLIG